jgi:hypothetical protein
MHGSSPTVLKPVLFFSSIQPTRWVLPTILVAFVLLGALGITNMGVVGEVAWGWMSADPSAHHAAPPPTHTWGPLEAATTRPMSSLVIAGASWPLAINVYTGGWADWPARALSPLGFEATRWLFLLGGALFIGLVHRFLRIHATLSAARIASLLLATDWTFVFFRRALGGTELMLHAATLLCLWSLWSRRWAGGRHGLTAFALGVGIGLSAKLTFVLTLAPLLITAWLMRWDKPRLNPPLPARWSPIVWALLIPMTPLLVAWAHLSLADLPILASHDHLSPQIDRLTATLTGGPRPGRESLAALLAWIGDGSSFLGAAWGAEEQPWFSPMRMLGWAVVLFGSFIAWRERDPTPRLALTRFCTVFVVLQVLFTWVVARDLHHLAIAGPTLMILAGLSIDAWAAQFGARISLKRGLVAILCCVPWVVQGVHSILKTDALLDSIQRPTVAMSGQLAIVELLERTSAERVFTMDYEAAGSLDVLAPEVRFAHSWTRVLSDREGALQGVLTQASGGHLLVFPYAPAWTYNLKPREADLERAAEQAGVAMEVVGRLPDDAAVLYAVD